MLKLDVYRISDLQNFMSLLNQFETNGVTDVRFIRQRVQNYLNGKFTVRRTKEAVILKREMIKNSKIPTKKCPSCNNGLLVGPYRFDGLVLYRCSRKCGYSEDRGK